MIEKGIVSKIVSENKVLIKPEFSHACKNCGACFKSGAESRVEAFTAFATKLGDAVEFEVKPSNVILATFMVFIMPIFALIAGYYLGGILSSFLMFFFYFAVLWIIDKKYYSKRIMCRITKILD